MNWVVFPEFALTTIILWFIAILLYSVSFIKKGKVYTTSATVFTIAGIVLLLVFVVSLWQWLQRPPMRTLGETRLWYSLFLSLIGFITYIRWNYKWFLIYSLGLSILFLFIDYFKPETYDKTLAPALQSPWFVPHVIVYMFAYALLAASSIVGIKGLIELRTQSQKPMFQNSLKLGDNLVYIGFAFLTAGLIFGALWAKVAWGSYWTWDPKETWAFLSWLAYLIYIHYRYSNPNKIKTALWILSLAFIVLLICWFGINYLPSAQSSVHVYSS